MKAYVHLKTFDGRSKFSTWFTRIAINTALMALRRKRSHPKTCRLADSAKAALRRRTREV
jgi:DNA-directed RNA polymerase specialized sigma24 family protein